MTLLTWNIRHGGGTRLARIVEEIAALRRRRDRVDGVPRRARQRTLCSVPGSGWPYVETTNPTGNENGIAVFRAPRCAARALCPAAPEHQVRWLDVDLPEYGFGSASSHHGGGLQQDAIR